MAHGQPMPVAGLLLPYRKRYITAMVSKTRDRLIEVARQLFARKGVENTTMADIATATEKGRRKIYTYFKNKREIHQAVIERESEQLVARERRIQQSSAPAAEKLDSFLRVRFGSMLQTGRQPEALSLRNLLDWKLGGKTRRLAARKEMEILRLIIREGVKKGEFDPVQAERLEPLLVFLAHAFFNPMLRENLEVLGYSGELATEQMVSFLMEAVKPAPGQPATDRQQLNTTQI